MIKSKRLEYSDYITNIPIYRKLNTKRLYEVRFEIMSKLDFEEKKI